MRPPAEPAAPRARGVRWVLALLGVLWLGWSLPLALGTRTLVARDVFTTHLPLKAFGAEALRAGRVPVFNPTWQLGQPFSGNPNAVPWYPGNLLYLVLPFWSAFNLHYVAHWLLAFLGMRALARGLGQGDAGAAMAGLVYAGSGYLLSALTYYNILTVVAWWPWAMWGAARGDRRGIALGGAACGLALLGGEPVTAALGLVPLVLVAGGGAPRRALRDAALIGGLGLLVALPQVVATLRVLPFTDRAVHGFAAGPASPSRLPLVRLLELVVALPFGHPFLVGPPGFVGYDFLPRLPYVLTLACGVVALGLAFSVLGVHRRLAALVLAGLGVPLALSAVPGAFERLTGGLARYPEKVVVWYALALPLLAGFGLERWLRRGPRVRRWLGAALGLAAAAAALVVLRAPVGALLRRHAPQLDAAGVAAQVGMSASLLLVGAAALGGAAWALRRRSPAGVLLAQLLSAAPHAVLLPTDATAPYRAAPPWTEQVPPHAAVFNGTFVTALESVARPHRLADGRLASERRLAALDLQPAPGALHGLRYPLAPDLDGMTSEPVARVLAALPKLAWSERATWWRLFGVDAAVLQGVPVVPGLRPIETASRGGVPTSLLAVEARLPRVWWPAALVGAASGEEAFRRVLALENSVSTAVVLGEPPAQDPHGAVTAIEEAGGEVRFEVESGGGVAVVTRAFQPLLEARDAQGSPLPTRRVDDALLGVVVPPGRHRVTVAASSRPETLAAAVGAAALVALLAVAGRAARVRGDPR